MRNSAGALAPRRAVECSKRQSQILAHLQSGCSEKETADRLGIMPSTVSGSSRAV
jgi:DNA-binding CsgD family transcriptional regulator